MRADSSEFCCNLSVQAPVSEPSLGTRNSILFMVLYSSMPKCVLRIYAASGILNGRMLTVVSYYRVNKGVCAPAVFFCWRHQFCSLIPYMCLIP